MTRKVIEYFFYLIMTLVGIALVFEGLGVHLTVPANIGIGLIVAVLMDWRMDGVK